MKDKLLRISEAAAMPGVSRPTLLAMRKAGKIKSYQLGPKSVRISERSILKFLEGVKTNG